MANTKKTIVITGASSGLGKALALQYASKDTRLFLFGRSVERLHETAASCKKKHAEVALISCDVEDEQQIRRHIEEISNKHYIDVLITSAGVSAGTLKAPETARQARQIFATNVTGSLNTIMPAIPFMIERKSGVIVVISSMAGLLGLSSCPSYSASKAAIKVFGDALRGYLRQFHIQVCVVVPGYIETPMTAVNQFPMPFKISAYKAAEIIIKGIETKKGLIVFPWFTYFLLKIANLLPYPLIDYINSKLPGKPSFDDV